VGGTAGNATLSIRFFQKQGLAPTIAVSSGVLNSAASFIVQIVLVVVGLLVTDSPFDVSTSGTSIPGWVVALAVVAVAAAVATIVVRACGTGSTTWSPPR